MPGGEIRIQFNDGFLAAMTGPVTKICDGIMSEEMFKRAYNKLHFIPLYSVAGIGYQCSN